MKDLGFSTVWVDTTEEAQCACDFLATQKLLAFDMEGIQLGKDGQISLMQLAAMVTSAHQPPEITVYIFDFLNLKSVSGALRQILQNPYITKLCYDCRCDSDALFSLHGITLAGVCDLQIAYTLLFQNTNDPYLKGFHKALAAPGILTPGSPVIAAKQHAKTHGDIGTVMMQRPLSPSTLLYCAYDVAYLFAMDALWLPRISRPYLLLLTKQRMHRFICRRAPWCMSRLDFSMSKRRLLLL